MKKILSLSFLVTSAIFATHEEGLRYGFGGRVGIAAFTGRICSTTQTNREATNIPTQVPTTNFYKVSQSIKPSTLSFQGGAFAEVGYRSCNWSYGALIDVNGDTLKTTDSLIITIPIAANRYPANAQIINQTCLKAPIRFGGDIRAGKYFGDALWCVLVGAEAIRIRYNHYYSDETMLGAAQIPPQTTVNPITFGIPCANKNNSCTTTCNTNNSKCNSFWKGALRIGTGIEYDWSDCVNVKLEYRFLWAGKKQIYLASPVVNGFGAGLATNGQILSADTLYFRQSVAALMVSYQF